MQKPTYRPIAALEVDDQALEQINDRLGVPFMVRARGNSAVTLSRRQAVVPSSRQQKLTVRIPVYLNDALKRQALERKTSIRHLVLLALRGAGHEVNEADLAPGAGGSG